jgi:hypothetical protein
MDEHEEIYEPWYDEFDDVSFLDEDTYVDANDNDIM